MWKFVHADALEYPYDSLSGTWKVVANLPYYISTPIIQRLILSRQKFTSLTLMLQKEVAERIAASPGGKEYGYLSVLVQLFTIPRIEFLVPPGAFTPRPEVDSAVITLTVRDRPAVDLRDEGFFIACCESCFFPAKKNSAELFEAAGPAPGRMDQVQEKTGIDLGRRAETLSIEEFGGWRIFYSSSGLNNGFFSEPGSGLD